MNNDFLITYYSGQFREICDLFHEAVHRTASGSYGPAELRAWAPEPRDYENWKWRCELKRPFVLISGEKLAGFAEFDPDGHIDCFYTHPDYNRQGVATMLLQHVEEIARRRNIRTLFTEASHVAKGFFLKHGFTVVRENRVERRGVVLTNWIMEKVRSGD